MIVNNHTNNNNLKLLIKKSNNIGYFYDLINKMSIVNIFPIYNDSENIITFTLYIIKIPFWYN